jgi:hypothetical protein
VIDDSTLKWPRGLPVPFGTNVGGPRFGLKVFAGALRERLGTAPEHLPASIRRSTA